MTGRRERQRAENTREIKEIALDLMAAGGPDAISLRAIAREMDITAGALYSYFPTRDDLITTLIDEVYTGLVDRLESARDKHTDPADRLLAWAEEFRTWSLANPQGFRLIYGDPVPGYRPPPGGPAPAAAHRACLGLIDLVATAEPPPGRYRWSDFGPDIVATARAAHPKLPAASIGLALRVWGRMHGLVALETYGHFGTQSTDPARLYRDEIRDLAASLTFT